MSIIRARPQHLVDGIRIRRILPRHHCRRVGPFIFMDYLAPEDIAPGCELYFPPHAHAGLRTWAWTCLPRSSVLPAWWRVNWKPPGRMARLERLNS